jgi:hypothetical protein
MPSWPRDCLRLTKKWAKTSLLVDSRSVKATPLEEGVGAAPVRRAKVRRRRCVRAARLPKVVCINIVPL